MHQSKERESAFNPLQDGIGRLVFGGSAHDAILKKKRRDDVMARKFVSEPQPIWILVSETN
jgi:hypothetical protein